MVPGSAPSGASQAVPMLLAELVSTSGRVGATRARLQKVKELSELLKKLSTDELGIAVGFLSGELRQGRIGIGYASIRDAVTAPAGEPTLELREVDETLERIARTAGRGSAGERQRQLGSLMQRATPAEQDFLGKLLTGELRQGALEGLMAEAIARTANVPAASVRRAQMLSGSMSEVAVAAVSSGEAGLASYRLELLRPIEPMLAQTAEDVPADLERMGAAAAEYKLDGARVQVHRLGDDVRIFTRGLHDVTARAPEIVELVRALPATQLVLDGEVLALREDGSPQPFQVTMRRFGRRLDIEAMRESFPLTPFFFDCLHLDGQDLIDQPGTERWRALASALAPSSLIPRREVNDAGAVEAFAREALDRGHEGLMLKSLAAPYEAGSRGASWLKLKPCHTLDLVVLAVEWGSGRRQGWLSNLHLGARDPKSGGFVMLGKTFKGMTDEMLRWQTTKLLELEVARDGHVVHVRPELVVEISFDGVQQSPHYPGGLALRFARVKRYRPDKRADEAESIETVRAIFAKSAGEAPGG
jgi:DNA ligase 1